MIINTAIIKQAFSCDIRLFHACSQEISHLVTSHNICEQALNDFLICKIAWNEYLEILESAGVKIDEYLKAVDDELVEMGYG